MQLLFASAEVTPYSKAGGLGDVAGSLPQALNHYLDAVQVITPLYGSIDREKYEIMPTTITGNIKLGKETFAYAIFEAASQTSLDNTFFVESSDFFDRSGVYTKSDGTGFPDNNLRYFFFQLVILDLLLHKVIKTDILHCNDHHSGLLPVLVRTHDLQIRTVLTIHNFLYHGHFSAEELKLLPEVTQDHLSKTQWDNYSALLEGIEHADSVTTVSPGYAQELLAGENVDAHSEQVLQAAKLKITGIINGIDTDYWSPEHDTYTPAHFSVNELNGKFKNKRVLLNQAGLDNDFEAPLIGSISRLVENKGFPLIVDLLDEFVKQGAMFIFLGSGDPVIAKQLQAASKRHPGRIAFDDSFNEPLAHLIEAGSDMFLMPSRFEPCGLNQLYSLRYGTIPIVHKTGGLGDTVAQWSAGVGTGFVFEPYELSELRRILGQALNTFNNKTEWTNLIKRAMSQDFSWDRSARQYFQLYQVKK